jgi:hypothetical protein
LKGNQSETVPETNPKPLTDFSTSVLHRKTIPSHVRHTD